MEFFDENIQTEYIADITNDKIERKREIDGYQYNMFQSTIVKDNIEYYCERINVNSDRSLNGINGLFFSQQNSNETRFEGRDIDAEDPRLFICNNKIYVIFNALSPFPGHKRSMAISEYESFHPIYLRIHDDQEQEQEQSIEKNWSPCVVNNQLYLIYLFSPLIVLHYDFNSEGKCKIQYKQKQNPELKIQSIYTPDKCLRGSSSFIPFINSFLGEFYIGLCHSYICKNGQHYYFAVLCVINVTKWEILYISKPIACRSLLTDNISKYLSNTDIICNYNRYYYKNTFLGNMEHIDITVVYPTSIYRENNDDDDVFIMILNLNKYSLKNKLILNIVEILQKIIEKSDSNMNNDWDDITRNYALSLIG